MGCAVGMCGWDVWVGCVGGMCGWDVWVGCVGCVGDICDRMVLDVQCNAGRTSSILYLFWKRGRDLIFPIL